MSSPAKAILSWRIPTSGDPRLFRLALAQIALATIVAALVLLVAAPRPWLGPALAGLVPLAFFMVYVRWSNYQQSLAGPDNVWIDAAGVHWVDLTGEERTFARDELLAFRVGRDEETIRPVPALTLELADGVESQPIELHPPATPAAVRRILAEHWRLTEQDAAGPSHGKKDYDLAVDVYSECHDEYQEWHWEGTPSKLAEFFSQFITAADQLPPPRPGIKPAQWIVLAQRRQSTRLRLQHMPAPHLEHDIIGGPAGLLREIATRADKALEDAPVPSDRKFEVPLGSKNRWTFHLHLRDA